MCWLVNIEWLSLDTLDRNSWRTAICLGICSRVKCDRIVTAKKLRIETLGRLCYTFNRKDYATTEVPNLYFIGVLIVMKKNRKAIVFCARYYNAYRIGVTADYGKR